MSTAQVSIELVLAGILALCAFVLPFLGGQDITTDLLQSNALIGVLGAAYLFGVVFDKLADTLLMPMENHLRLKQAAKYLHKKPKFKGKDAFPQNILEFRLRKAQDGRLQWMESLKSRIRTSRELAVLGLPAALGIIVYQDVTQGCGAGSEKICASEWIYAFIGINLLLLVTAVWKESRDRDEDTDQKNPRAIKTDDLHKDENKRRRQLDMASTQMHVNALPYYLLIANSSIGIVVVSIRNSGDSSIALIGAGGLILTLLSLWACLRITRTFMKFVAREMGDYLKEKSK